MTLDLSGRELIVGVCGGIAAYKVCDVVSQLVQRGAGVRVVMTRSARRFITPLTFQALTERPVFTSLWHASGYHGQQHIQLTESAELMLVAPATANILAKAAYGLADDLLSTMILSAACPVLLAPSMNTRMLEHPAVQENIERLAKRGLLFVEPHAGWLACRSTGAGRLAEPAVIVEAVVAALGAGGAEAMPSEDPGPRLRILVNAGPTREYFDTVRFITNASTGKQGYAIAERAAQRGHAVVLVSGPVALPAPQGVTLVSVASAAEMAVECQRRFEDCAAAVLTAAVCDYRPPHRLAHKLGKLDRPFAVTLEPTEDIAASLGRVKGRRVVMGFAMNDQDARQHAERKCREKNCDWMVLNGLANVGADDATVQCYSVEHGWRPPRSGSKQSIAEHLLDLLEHEVAARCRS